MGILKSPAIAGVIVLFAVTPVALPEAASAVPGPVPPVSAPANGAGGGGVLAKNPDGTWTRWGPWKPRPVSQYPAGGYRNPLATYSDSEINLESRIYRAMELETGTTGQTAKDVEGITHTEAEHAHEAIEKLRTGKPYATAGEEAVGEDLVQEAESGGLFPDVATVSDALNGVTAAAGAAYIGVSLGNGIDRLLHIPTLPFGLFAEETSKSGERTVEYTYHEDRAVKWLTGMKPCISALEQPEHERCQYIQTQWKVQERFYEGEENFYNTMRDQFYGVPYSFSGPANLQPPCPTAPWVRCKIHTEGETTSIYTYVTANQKYLTGAAFPAKDLDETYAPKTTSEFPTARSEPVTPVHSQPPTRPELQNPPAQDYIFSTVPELEPIEGTKVPDPTKLVEVPKPEEEELATHYKPRVETAGFTHVRINTLPESQIDTRIGPEEVSKVTPASGTLVDPSTEVVIDANPSDAPDPQESEGGGGGEPPALPGIKLPKLGVACHNFPFGVPCWIVEEFSAWSATSKTPEWETGSYEVHGHKVPSAKVSLAFLEPVMVIARPFMILFSTIGLVILFYRWSTGKNVGTTGDSMPAESTSEHGAWPEGDE